MITLFTLLFLAIQPSSASWSENDLSILLPLPKQEEMPNLLHPQSGNTLLPLPVFEGLPTLVTDLDSKTIYETALSVVAIRFDPCFKAGDLPCERQIRLVWQPIVFDRSMATTLDAAVHTFYPLTEAEWNSVLEELQPWRLGNNQPLNTHPRLTSERYAGDFWSELRRIILRFCHSSSLSRATAMTVNPIGTVWTFSGLDVKRNGLEPMMIPRVNETVQGFFANIGGPRNGEFRAAMHPFPLGESPFLRVLNDSKSSKSDMPKDELIEATKSALRLENPRHTNPGTVDCASCHAAHAVTSWSLRNFRNWDWRETFASELFRLGRKSSLPIPSDKGPNVLRAFGYFESEPMISRRVRYETMEAVERVNAEALE